MPVSTRGSAKRSRDESDISGDERAAKRPSTPFFRRVEPSFHERARSARKATPKRVLGPIQPYTAGATSRFRDANPESHPQLMPTGDTDEQKAAPSQAAVTSTSTQQQPQQQSTVGWLWSSARRFIPGMREQLQEPVATQDNMERSACPSPSDGRSPLSPLENLPPLPFPQTQAEDDPNDTYRRLKAMRKQKAEDFTPAARARNWDPAQRQIERQQREARFSTLKSNKRKLTDEADESERAAKAPRNSFQPPSVEDDEDDIPEVVTPSKNAEVLLKTPERQPQIAATPLKSALRTGNKSKLNVEFDESSMRPNQSEVKTIWRDYGPAGHYTGTTFLDPMDLKNKKHFERLRADRSPKTNSDPRFMKSNTFGICDEDLEYDDTLTPEEEAQVAALEAAQSAPPTAPRPAHAELPKADDTATPASRHAAFKPDASSQKVLDEQRARANKYKPKKSSGLSHVEPARSRSSSPPRGESAITATTDDVPALSDDNGDNSDEPVSPTPPSAPLAGNIGSTLTAPVVLEDTLIGEDGLTDYGREHQFDDWAKGLDWPKPQTYVESGVCSAYIDDLLRKKWTSEDEKITSEWWQKEFEDVEVQMNRAKREGRELELVWGDEVDAIA